MLAVVLLNVTELVPCVVPKFVPVIVTCVPAGPAMGEMLNTAALLFTVKLTPLLETPPTLTKTLPVVAPTGTVTEIDVLLHAETVAGVPLNLTVLLPCDVPKLNPVIVTGKPIGPTE